MLEDATPSRTHPWSGGMRWGSSSPGAPRIEHSLLTDGPVVLVLMIVLQFLSVQESV